MFHARIVARDVSRRPCRRTNREFAYIDECLVLFRTGTCAKYHSQLSHTPSTRRNSANKRAFGVSCCLPFPAEGGCCEDLCSAVFAEPAASFFPLDARPRRTPNGALDVRRRGWFPPPGPPRGKSGIATITKTLLVRYPPPRVYSVHVSVRYRERFPWIHVSVDGAGGLS